MTLRALLIDDDSRIAEHLSTYLAPHGVELTHAADGPRGLSRLKQGAFDVVLLDLTMPGMDGLEVCRRIREHSRVPILMLTARGDETDRVVGLELGADDYLPKPYSPRELLARIRAVLRRAQPDVTGELVRVADLEIDVGARRATLQGRAGPVKRRFLSTSRSWKSRPSLASTATTPPKGCRASKRTRSGRLARVRMVPFTRPLSVA